MRKEFYKHLSALFKTDPRVVILLGDIGVFSFDTSFKHDKSRIYNMGIMEQTMIGVSSALSSKGFVPFVHSIAPFVSERCYEQLKLNLGYECRNVFVVSVGNSYDYAGLGVTHHCANDLKIINAIPNFKVYCPGNQYDVEEIIKNTINLEQPKYIRLSEQGNNLTRIHSDLAMFKACRNGITIIVGNAVKDVKKVASSVSSAVLYTYNISDFDILKLNKIINELGIKKDIIVIEPCADSGIVSKIALGVENVIKITSIAVPKQFIDKYGSKKEIDRYLELDDDNIIKRINERHTTN